LPIDLNRCFQIVGALQPTSKRGLVCTLGVQDFSQDQNAFDDFVCLYGLPTNAARCIFTSLGFAGVEALDVSKFEGCDHVFDLNSPEILPELMGRFDVVFTGGTLEHVFDQRAALKNVFDLLSSDGLILHTGPSNGWLDHGFYQFSPTFFTDYYAVNRFEIRDAQLMVRDGVRSGVKIVHYCPGMFDGVPNGAVSGVWNYFFVLEKTTQSTCTAIPQQSAYSNLHEDLDSHFTRTNLPTQFPYRLVAGRRQEVESQFIDFPEPVKGEGSAWTISLPEWRHVSNETGNHHSCLMLRYKGDFLGPGNSLYVTVAQVGKGAHAHWGDNLYFSLPTDETPNWEALEILVDLEAAGL